MNLTITLLGSRGIVLQDNVFPLFEIVLNLHIKELEKNFKIEAKINIHDKSVMIERNLAYDWNQFEAEFMNLIQRNQEKYYAIQETINSTIIQIYTLICRADSNCWDPKLLEF